MMEKCDKDVDPDSNKFCYSFIRDGKSRRKMLITCVMPYLTSINSWLGGLIGSDLMSVQRGSWTWTQKSISNCRSMQYSIYLLSDLEPRRPQQWWWWSTSSCCCSNCVWWQHIRCLSLKSSQSSGYCRTWSVVCFIQWPTKSSNQYTALLYNMWQSEFPSAFMHAKLTQAEKTRKKINKTT